LARIAFSGSSRGTAGSVLRRSRAVAGAPARVPRHRSGRAASSRDMVLRVAKKGRFVSVAQGAVLILLASSALSLRVQAFDPNTGRTYIFDTTSCGQYNQDRKLPGPGSADKMFVAGWLTAYNSLVSGADVEGDSRLDDTFYGWTTTALTTHLRRCKQGCSISAERSHPALQDQSDPSEINTPDLRIPQARRACG
jgi:hypothetical protein